MTKTDDGGSIANGFIARPSPNGGWIVTSKSGENEQALELGAFSDFDDMMRWLSVRVPPDHSSNSSFEARLLASLKRSKGRSDT